MPKGRKVCPDCGDEHGVRTKECSCGFKFKFKPSVRRGKEIDVSELNEGDVFRIIGGTGSFWYSGRTGEKIYSQDRYKLVFKKFEKDGILAFGKYGHEYIYIGESYISKITGLHYRKPRIKLIKRKKSKDAR